MTRQLQYIVDGNPSHLKRIKVIDDYLHEYTRPVDVAMQNADNYLAKFDKDFQDACNALEELGVHRPEDLSMFEYFSKIRYFEAKNKPK